MNTHLTSTTKRCAGYLQGKLRDLGLDYQDELTSFDHREPDELREPDEHWIDEESEEIPYEPFFFQPVNDGVDEFHF